MYSSKKTDQPLLTAAPTYPCPCRHGANLVPIYLTDAYGCDRCPQMFVLGADGKLEEQLTAGSPYARVWRWTGQQWKMIYPTNEPGLLGFFALLFLLVVGWFLLAHLLPAPFSHLYWVIGIVTITFVIPTLQSRFTQRR